MKFVYKKEMVTLLPTVFAGTWDKFWTRLNDGFVLELDYLLLALIFVVRKFGLVCKWNQGSQKID